MLKKPSKYFILGMTIVLIIFKSAISPAQENNGKYFQMYYAALRLSSEGKNQQAIAQFKEIIQQNPSFPRAYVKIVLLYKRMNDLNSAAEYFQHLATENNRNGYAYYCLGLLEEYRGNFIAAKANTLQAIELVPQYVFCYKNLVDVYKNLEQLDQAEKFFTKKIRSNPPNAAVYFGLAYLYRNKREWQKAHEYYEKTIELNSDIYLAYEQKGILYYYAGENQAFLNYSLSGLKLAEKNNDLEYEARFLGNAAAASLNLSRYADALNYFQRSLKLNKEFGNQKTQERIYVNMGVIYRDTQKYRQSLNYFKKALEISKYLGDKNVEALCYRHIGSVYLAMREFEQGIANFNRAEALVNQIDDVSIKKVFFWSMGADYYEMADFSGSLKYSQKAYRLAVELGDQNGQQRNMNMMGLACWNLGQYTRALDYFEKALTIAQNMGDKNGQSYGLGNMAIIFDVMGDYDRSLSYYNQALQIARSAKNKKEAGRLLGNIGVAYQRLRNHEKAKKYYVRAIKIAKEIGDEGNESELSGNLGQLFYEIGKFEEADSCFQKALAIATAINNKKLEGDELINLGKLNLLKNNLPEAKIYYQKTLRIGKRIGNPELIWDSNAGLASVYEAKGEVQKALRYYRKAMDHIDKVRSGLQLAEFKAGFLVNKTAVFEKTINLLAELHQKSPQQGYAEKAFYYSEKARARAFLDLLAESRASVESGISEAQKIKEREILRKISDLQTKLQNSNLVDSKWKELMAQLEQVEEKFNDLKREMRKNNPRYANLIYPQPYSLNQIRKKVLDRESALIEFSLGDSSSFVWIITADKTNLFRLPQRAEIENDVRHYLQTISRPANLANAFAKHNTLGFKLYQKLLGRFSRTFQEKSFLYIVPDGILHYLPMETLITKKSTDSQTCEYLISKFTISYAPSASVLCFLKEKKQKHVRGRKSLLAFGDPYFGGGMELMAVRGENTPLDPLINSSDEIQFRSDSLTRGLYERRGFKFKRLSFSGVEIAEISSIFPADDSRIYFGEAAKEEVVKSIDLSKYKYIHFATHGMIDQKRPSRSAIVLTLDGDPAEDGFLQMNEILNLKLDADLVTLSACQTGLGKLQKGEGVVGLTRAFIYAGTPAVVVSLWNINDRSTAGFMKDFYQFLQNGNEPAIALRLAKINMLHSARKLYRHPYYWAPFVLIGNTR
ncbi:MAG: CHAT domain-containing protein [Calditrichaeota bacterium]|nr:CHAT domain-containing protein [Calditrichota bacterium]